jgi:protocatechuate 4,5-dioxygenase alpha chain
MSHLFFPFQGNKVRPTKQVSCCGLGATFAQAFRGPVNRSDRKETGMSATTHTLEIEDQIPGTYIFDGEAAMKGYALNKMCFSFNNAENRAEFLKDEDAYCRKYGLTDEQRKAIRERNVLAMIHAGGCIYYLAKFAGIFGLNVQDVGAQQRGISVEAFKKLIKSQG